MRPTRLPRAARPIGIAIATCLLAWAALVGAGRTGSTEGQEGPNAIAQPRDAREVDFYIQQLRDNCYASLKRQSEALAECEEVLKYPEYGYYTHQAADLRMTLTR